MEAPEACDAKARGLATELVVEEACMRVRGSDGADMDEERGRQTRAVARALRSTQVPLTL